MTRPRFLPDNFTLTLIATVILASLLPASGQTAVAFGWVTNLAIALLFFLHGAKLSNQAIIAGAGHWRLHLLVFSLTFVLFPSAAGSWPITANRCCAPPWRGWGYSSSQWNWCENRFLLGRSSHYCRITRHPVALCTCCTPPTASSPPSCAVSLTSPCRTSVPTP